MAIEYIQAGLRKLSIFQQKHLVLMFVLIGIFTAISIVGVTKIEFESDFTKFNPEGIPIIELQEEINSEFNSLEGIIVMVEIDSDDRIDIREPEIIEFLVRLENELRKEEQVQDVFSAGSIFSQGVPPTLEEVKLILEEVPQSNNFFSGSYSITPLVVTADLGGDDEKVKLFNDKISSIVEDASAPGGTNVIITGIPPLFSRVFNLLISDALYTMILASVAIYVLLLFIERSFTKALIILLPLLFGVTWTMGAMGWLGIALTIGTVSISAMLLGLGVEYSIFVIERYKEERKKNDHNISLQNSLSKVGSSITGSGMTTIFGFGALGLSLFPILADLGKSLAIGIGFMLLATIFVSPVFLTIEDKLKKNVISKTKKKKNYFEPIFESYGSFVANKPSIVLVLGILFTVFMFVQMQNIELSDVDFDTVLPSDLAELRAFNLIDDEFGETGTGEPVTIYIKLEPSLPGTDEPTDIRDVRVLTYVDILANKVESIHYIESAGNLARVVKESNQGVIPSVIVEEDYSFGARPYLNDDYSATRIRVELRNVDLNAREVSNELKEVISETEKPTGIGVYLAGEAVLQPELDDLNGPDTARTSGIAFGAIIILLLILSRSIKFTILPLVTVILGIMWTLGFVGLFKTPFNNITTSVITMTIGIGIDFGLQLMVRYRQELETKNKREAMKDTLKNILTPMLITTAAALIGFRAMSLGQLQIMGQLGIVMGYGVVASMLAAITVVASLMVIFQRKKK